MLWCFFFYSSRCLPPKINATFLCMEMEISNEVCSIVIIIFANDKWSRVYWTLSFEKCVHGLWYDFDLCIMDSIKSTFWAQHFPLVLHQWLAVHEKNPFHKFTATNGEQKIWARFYWKSNVKLWDRKRNYCPKIKSKLKVQFILSISSSVYFWMRQFIFGSSCTTSIYS